MAQSSAHCHKRIAAVAKEAARASYAELMSSSNLTYQLWKKTHPTLNAKRLEQHWVNTKWGLYVPIARTTLGLLLSQPIDESLKDEIVEILALDQTLIRGRVNPAMVAGQVLTPK